MKKTILTLTLCLISMASFAQPDYAGALTGKNLSWISDCVKPGIAIVHSQYVLEDYFSPQHERYGIDDKSFYGEGYALAFRFPNGYIIYDNAIHPWNYDPNYKDYYNPEDTLRPVYNNTTFNLRDLGNSNPTNLNFTEVYITNSPAVSMIKQPNSDNTTLPVCYDFGKVQGVIIWAHIPEKENLSLESNVDLSVVNFREVTIPNGKNDHKINVNPPNTPYKYIGGLYIVPKSSHAGKLDLEVRGVLVFDNGQWYISLLSPSNDTQQTDTTVSSNNKNKKPETNRVKTKPPKDKKKPGKGKNKHHR